MTEKIGNVTLDLTHYSGQDLYCDGPTEDEILSIVRNYRPDQYDGIIRDRKKWEILYHLSTARGNIVDWIPFTGTEKVLEIGAGPGAITGTLAAKCGHVDCVDLSRKRSEINAYRNRSRDNITIYVGNFEEVEPSLDRDYDYIFLIGVFEYAGSYISTEAPFHTELTRILQHVRRSPENGALEGRVVIAIENRLGLKYFAGCAEDHSGKYFENIESYDTQKPTARTFSRPALEKIFGECGLGQEQYSFYYPYPDYKFMDTLYSDKKLPEYTQLSENIRNFDRDRLLLFDERKAYKGLLEDGLYPLFSNSYEIVIGPSLPVIYCKYCTDRAAQYRISTVIVEEDGEKKVRKYAAAEEARQHVLKMAESCSLLSERYLTQADGSGELGNAFSLADMEPNLQVAACSVLPDHKGVEFEYIKGRTLESLLDEKLDAGDREGFTELLGEYTRRVGAGEEGAKASDDDMTFTNIIVSKDMWTAIDYEWAVDGAVPVRELLCRSILCYFLEDQSRRRKVYELIPEEELLSLIGVTKDEAVQLAEKEAQFQKKVTGGILSLGGLRAQMGPEVIKPALLQTDEEKEIAYREQLARAEEEERRAQEEERNHRALVTPQIYYDMGDGYKEEDSFFLNDWYKEEGMLTFRLDIPRAVRKLRIDPSLCPGVVRIREVRCAGKNLTDMMVRYVKSCGRKSGCASWVFDGSDPWFEWDMKKIRRKAGIRTDDGAPADSIAFTLQFAGIPSTMADGL